MTPLMAGSAETFVFVTSMGSEVFPSASRRQPGAAQPAALPFDGLAVIGNDANTPAVLRD
ncbi:hypothetical protein HFO28_32880 [Rhizobium leguminosarum]|uniref:hypothetical protein n=1 Tax=Rhizobium leguminosarum TaxID=384 RepID=UPI001C979CD0|nr:hypothetical protein [Rhizobium leguminosarum]MBY5748318.1 hypothetical protein [Rhizobium leguminosarum]